MSASCVRCKRQPGTVLVHNVCAGSGDAPNGRGPVVIPIYACETCAERIDPAAARAHREQKPK